MSSLAPPGAYGFGVTCLEERAPTLAKSATPPSVSIVVRCIAVDVCKKNVQRYLRCASAGSAWQAPCLASTNAGRPAWTFGVAFTAAPCIPIRALFVQRGRFGKRLLIAGLQGSHR